MSLFPAIRNLLQEADITHTMEVLDKIRHEVSSPAVRSALSALAAAGDHLGYEEIKKADSLAEFRKGGGQLVEVLDFLSIWYDGNLAQLSWLIATSLVRLETLLSSPSEFAKLQEPFLALIESGIRADATQNEYYDNLAYCLSRLDQELLTLHGYGSRALVGTILLLTKRANLLLRLTSQKKNVRFDIWHIKSVCKDFMQLSRDEHLLAHVQRHKVLDTESGHDWAYETIVPALALCNVMEYDLFEVNDWYAGSGEPPFCAVIFRTISGVADRLKPADCQRILADLQGKTKGDRSVY
jgi:hypothetical protein